LSITLPTPIGQRRARFSIAIPSEAWDIHGRPHHWRVSAMDVADWLRRLGLEQYEPAFRANEIDARVLPSLTAEDLKDLGITLVGHRRRLLDAIAVLGADVPIAAVTGASAPADAERRQLTVMFCDLVGSTALAARLDPEDLREIIGTYHCAVADTAAPFDGFVAKYMGDGVLVSFGYPRAHEDDAERAVRAGLGVIDAVGRLAVKTVALQARVGIATGLVVVGDLIGEGSAQEQSVVGETPNLAARLQSLAEPDAVVIAAGTRRLVGNLCGICARRSARGQAGEAGGLAGSRRAAGRGCGIPCRSHVPAGVGAPSSAEPQSATQEGADMEALVRQFEGLARREPVVMVFEDAHWIDPTSRELLDLTVERPRTLPALLIVTFRPEFQPPSTGQPQVTMLTLNRLDRRDRIALYLCTEVLTDCVRPGCPALMPVGSGPLGWTAMGGFLPFLLCPACDAYAVKVVICRSTGSGVVSSDRSPMTMR
jgi:class 3 adenylate cyclase